ncbi:hypothetical protein ACP70R_020580 [Stipagrostis hirtigluma subsp. patula]
MMTYSRTLLLLIVATVFCAATAGISPGDDWAPVDFVDNPFIQDMGRWAVDQKHTVLNFDKVFSAYYQNTDDTGKDRNYELYIYASKRAGAGNDIYRAVVYVLHGLQYQSLLAFEIIKEYNRPPRPGQLSTGRPAAVVR